MATAIAAAVRLEELPVDRGLTVTWGLILSGFMGITVLYCEEFHSMVIFVQ